MNSTMKTQTRSRKKSLFIFIIIFSFSVQLMGQRHFVRNFSARDGLSQSEVSDMVQDRTGRLFICTASSGIDVFDGVSFSRLSTEDGLISPYMTKILKDNQGDIWFASTAGINMYRQDTILSFAFDRTPYGTESIFGMKELEPHHFLLSTDKGLIDFNQGVFTVYQSDEFPSMRIFDVLVTKTGSILLISDEGLFEFINGSIVRSAIGKGFKKTSFLAILETDSGEILLGTRKGYYQVKSGRLEFVQLFEDEAYSVICFLQTGDGNIYAGTNGQGLYLKENNTGHIERIHEGNGLSDDFTWSLYEDMESNIWIGTSGAGLDLLAADHFQIFTPEDGLGNDIVYEVLARKNGEMWFGIIQGGITVFKEGAFKNYTVKDGLSHLSIRCFHDEGDTLWIGTEHGLTVYVNNKFTDVSDLFKLRNYSIFDIHRDSLGALWFACKGERYYGENGGVMRYNRGTLERFTIQEGMTSNNVYCISERARGRLMFGTTAGITQWNGAYMEPLGLEGSSACHGTTLAIKQDHTGNTWVGTVGGLGLIKDGEFECFSKRPGLIGSTIYLLELQGDSILWVGSSSGLEKLDLNYFYENDSIVTTLYNDFNGFFGTECNQNASTKDGQGNYWFGTIGGVVKYLPKKDRHSTFEPRIEISQVNKKGKATNWRELGFKINEKGLPIDLYLNYDENSLQIEFIGINLLDPKDQEYSFMLEGADEDWSDFQKERSVFYSNLTPGEYTFHVRSRDCTNGRFSEEIAYSFIIIPAYWQTVSFMVAMILLFAAAVLVYFILRVQSIRAHEAEKSDFKHRLAEIEMTALRAQMNPHFLFNSLNSVNNFIIQNKKEEASEYLTKFSRLVRMVLQNSKEKLVSLEDELTALRLYIEMESLRFNNRFTYIEDIDRTIVIAEVKLPPLLLQPYTENSIWHGLLHLTERKGELRLIITVIEHGVRIVIQDNGVGRASSEMLKSKSAMKKKSMGMKLNEDRMGLSKELHSLSIDVQLDDLVSDKEIAIGTRVTINLRNHGN
jgi:ligand-binding sensor domain-containing protein